MRHFKVSFLYPTGKFEHDMVKDWVEKLQEHRTLDIPNTDSNKPAKD